MTRYDLAANTRPSAAIILNLHQETQQQTVQKAVENLVDLHASGMVQHKVFWLGCSQNPPRIVFYL
jgi:hypothetical protein